uniref:Integrase catalytic domain-containing protein n=1 Tax=Meloidogyne enterolobii TaxID=390850 RepID=A0A6V7VHP1_MELEN|nr:unnamed protein product [Meloidogyne enterolobii]CAD2190019.1 unnamed protein product [Meloidogyne enterolobii]CAD2200791.1 unnamed protein product [Meloidogyne enterolobii]
MADYTKLLQHLYNDPESPAAFSGIDRLWHEARKVLKNLPRSVVQDFLEGHRTYTLMRPKRIHFPRSKTVASGFMTDVQVDLADFQSLSRHNKGNRYLLLGIDVLSKRVFGIAVKSKKAEDMLDAFKQLIEQMPMKPHRIFSDRGLEFKNRQIKEFFEKEEIEKFEATHSTVKASLAERSIRNVKQRLYRYFAHYKTLNWIEILPKIWTVSIRQGVGFTECALLM